MVISMLAPGQGMRRAAYPDLARGTGDGSWAVAARAHTALGPVDIGTGIQGGEGTSERQGRVGDLLEGLARDRQGRRLLQDLLAPALDRGLQRAEVTRLPWVSAAICTSRRRGLSK